MRSTVLLLLAAAVPAIAADSFVVQWKNADAKTPWLAQLELRPMNENLKLTTGKAAVTPEFPNGLRVKLTNSGDGEGWIQVKLAGGYGFAFSDRMLDQHPYLWVRDMGVFISRLGAWSETESQRSEAAKGIDQSLSRPFVSCTEKYFQWTGYVEHGPKLDQKIWDFVKEKESWPVEARSLDQMERMPEVDASYFADPFSGPEILAHVLGLAGPQRRVYSLEQREDRRLFTLGGRRSQALPGFAMAAARSRLFAPVRGGRGSRFREYGDESVQQHLEDGFDLVGVTEWNDADLQAEQTNFAYPLDGEEIKSGVEPLLAFTRLRIRNQRQQERQSYLGVEFTNQDFGGRSRCRTYGISRGAKAASLCWDNSLWRPTRRYRVRGGSQHGRTEAVPGLDTPARRRRIHLQLREPLPRDLTGPAARHPEAWL